MGIMTSSLAQTPNIEWAVDMGAFQQTGDDYGKAITHDGAGNVISTGVFERHVDFDPGPGTSTLLGNNPGWYSTYIQKLSPSGTLIWAKGMRGTNARNVISASICTDANDNVYVIGEFEGQVDFDPNFGVDFYVTAIGTSANFFILKLDPNGNFLWVKTLGEDIGECRGFDVVAEGSSHVFVTGTFSETIDFDPGPGIFPLSAGSYPNAFTLKLDANGNFVWVKSPTLGGTNDASARSIELDGNNHIYISGVFSGTVDFGGGNILYASGNNSNNKFLQKMDASGATLWARGGTTGTAGGANIVADPSNNIIAVGNFSISMDGDPGSGISTFTSVGGSDGYIQKLDPMGNLLWVKHLGGSGFSNYYAVDVDPAGNLYTTGIFSQVADFDLGPGFENHTETGNSNKGDVFLQKLDANGNFSWAETMGGNYYDVGQSIVVDPGNNIYSTGGFELNADFHTGTPLLATGWLDLDAWVQKYAQCIPRLLNTDFTYEVICTPGQESILSVTGVAQPAATNPYHQFNLYEYPSNTSPTFQEPYVDIVGWFSQPAAVNYTYSAAAQAFSYTLKPGFSYYVKRGLWDDCTPWVEKIKLGIDGPMIPSCTISSITPMCEGSPITFEATITNVGITPTFQWYLNGNPVSTGNTYTSSAFSDNDEIYCVMSSSLDCVMPISVTSNTQVLDLPSPPSVVIDAFSGACGVTTPILTANVTGVGPYNYSWNNDAGMGQTFPNTGADTYTVTVTDPNGCTGSASLFLPTNLPGGYGGIDFDQLAKKTARLDDGVTSDRSGLFYFGNNVAIHNNYAIIGAYQNKVDKNGHNGLNNAGAAYIFEKGSNWVQAAKVTPEQRYNGDFFGASVSISGDLAVVGAKGHDYGPSGSPHVPNAGAAYVFERDAFGNWNEIIKLIPSTLSPHDPNDWSSGDNFGYTVAIHGDNIIVGAPGQGYDSNGSNFINGAGAVYIFNRHYNNWGEVQKITAPVRQNNVRFGHSVAISNDHFIVGAPLDGYGGKAYIFNYNGNVWTLAADISGSDADNNDAFGWSVGISGDNALVGAKDEDAGQGTAWAGSAYFFNRNYPGVNGWGETQKVIASDYTIADNFGTSVSISGSYAVVGAQSEGHDANGNNFQRNAGSAYVFELNAGVWNEVNKIVASDRQQYDSFGRTVAISGNNVVVGADNEDHDENGATFKNNAGSVYFYEGGCACDLIVTTFGSGICEGASDGSVSVFNIQGGQGPYTFLWDTGHTTPGVTGLTAGNYQVTVTDANGCSATKTASVIAFICERELPRTMIISQTTDSIDSENDQRTFEDLQKKSTVSVLIFPNPATSDVTFVCEHDDNQELIIDQIDVLDAMGKAVRSIPADTRTFNVSDLSSGVYILRIQTKGGISLTRFVKD